MQSTIVILESVGQFGRLFCRIWVERFQEHFFDVRPVLVPITKSQQQRRDLYLERPHGQKQESQFLRHGWEDG